MNQSSTFLFRILFALPFVVFGIMHLMNAEKMGGMVPSYFPGGGVFWVYLVGVCFLLSALGLIVNKFAKEAGYLLAFVLLVLLLTIHLPGVLAGNSGSLGGLLKDFSLMSAALFISNYSKG
ncbi:MAG TPA: DoxX family membrane protein [Daejeonella sp.]|nr:DoxX family membrane protein [Daejeonella sp.]